MNINVENMFNFIILNNNSNNICLLNVYKNVQHLEIIFSLDFQLHNFKINIFVCLFIHPFIHFFKHFFGK